MMRQKDVPDAQGPEAYEKDTISGYAKGGRVKKKAAPANRYAKKKK